MLSTRVAMGSERDICLSVARCAATGAMRFEAYVAMGSQPTALLCACSCDAPSPRQLSAPVSLDGARTMLDLVTQTILGIAASNICNALHSGDHATTADAFAAMVRGATIEGAIGACFEPMSRFLEVRDGDSSVVPDDMAPDVSDDVLLCGSVAGAQPAAAEAASMPDSAIAQFVMGVKNTQCRDDIHALLTSRPVADVEREMSAVVAMHCHLLEAGKGACRYTLADGVNCTSQKKTCAVTDLVVTINMNFRDMASHLYAIYVRRNKRKRQSLK